MCLPGERGRGEAPWAGGGWARGCRCSHRGARVLGWVGVAAALPDGGAAEVREPSARPGLLAVSCCKPAAVEHAAAHALSTPLTLTLSVLLLLLCCCCSAAPAAAAAQTPCHLQA